jgi:hypothetical protein
MPAQGVDSHSRRRAHDIVARCFVVVTGAQRHPS